MCTHTAAWSQGELNMPIRSKGIVSGVTIFVAASALALAQAPPAQQAAGENSKWMYNGRNRVIGSGGPAPVHDLSGTWAGPRSGAGVPDYRQTEIPPLTPLGQKLFSDRKSLDKFSPAGTNDPFVRTCDPLGFPRADVDEIRGISFATMPNRIVVLYQFQQVWREIWMDGRELPKNVGGTEKGAPDPRDFGYSVGHWENDNTLVVDSTGLDDRSWLDRNGHPHTVQSHVQERFTRTDHNDLQLTITVDDPTIYTKPVSLGTVYFKWIPNQIFDEKLCIPSETIEYLQSVGDPAGSSIPAK
jgi:hypothetical protein